MCIHVVGVYIILPKGLKRDLDQTDIFFIGGWLGGQVTIRERIQKRNA